VNGKKEVKGRKNSHVSLVRRNYVEIDHTALKVVLEEEFQKKGNDGNCNMLLKGRNR